MAPEPNLAGMGGAKGSGGGAGGGRGRSKPRSGGGAGLGLAFDTSGVREFTREMEKATKSVEKLFAPFKDVDKLSAKMDTFFKGVKKNLTQVEDQAKGISFDFGSGTSSGGGVYSGAQSQIAAMSTRGEKMRSKGAALAAGTAATAPADDGGGGSGGRIGGALNNFMRSPSQQAVAFSLGTVSAGLYNMGPGISAMDTSANLWARQSQGGYSSTAAADMRRNLPQIPGTYGREDTAGAMRVLQQAGVGVGESTRTMTGVGSLVQTMPGVTATQGAQAVAGLYSPQASNQLMARGIMTSPGGKAEDPARLLTQAVSSLYASGNVTESQVARLRQPGSPERKYLEQMVGPEAAALAVEQSAAQVKAGGGTANAKSDTVTEMSDSTKRKAGVGDTLEERTRSLAERKVGASENIAEDSRTMTQQVLVAQEGVVTAFGVFEQNLTGLSEVLGGLGGTVTGLGGVMGTFRGAIDTMINFLILRSVGGMGAGALGKGGKLGGLGKGIGRGAGKGVGGALSGVGGSGALGAAGKFAGGAGVVIGAAQLAQAADAKINTSMEGKRPWLWDMSKEEGEDTPGYVEGWLKNAFGDDVGDPIGPGGHVNAASSVWNWREPPGVGDAMLRGPGKSVGMNADFLTRMKQMFADNPRLSLNSGFRSSAEQKRLYDRYKAGVPGQAPAAPPGRSNHEKGTAADIGPRSEYGWLAANAPKYGLKKPMSYEPWHWEPSNTVGGASSAPPTDTAGAPVAGAVEQPKGVIDSLMSIMGLGSNESNILSKLGAKEVAGAAEAVGVSGGGGALTDLNASQEDIVRKILEVGRGMGASPKAILAAVETGWVESGLKNIRGGDRDSLGVFQQRPSQGWGSPAQIMDVSHAARSFLSRAMGSDLATAGAVAAAVQRPAAQYRGRYQEMREKAIGSLASVGYDASGVAGDPIPAGGGWSPPVPSAGTGMMMGGGGGGGGGVVIQKLEVKVELARGSVEEAERFGRYFVELVSDRDRLTQIASG